MKLNRRVVGCIFVLIRHPIDAFDGPFQTYNDFCAERLPQHCHRSLIADYLTLQGLRVIHLLDPTLSQEHQLREELRRESLALVYDRLS